MLRLFDDIKHKGEEGKPHSESDFSYLNRIDRIEARRIRKVLEDWFSRYPQEHQTDLRIRFRSTEFHSAFFELLLHEILFCLNCDVKVHPDLQDYKTKRPDFLVKSNNSKRFILEATSTTDMSEREMANEKIKDLIYDKINEKLISPDYFIIIQILATSTETPSSSGIVSFLAERLADLNYNEISMIASEKSMSSLPHFTYEKKNWIIDFIPWPKPPEARGSTELRPIIGQSIAFHEVDTWRAIRDAILSKAGYYGEMNMPFVIALNVLRRHVADLEILDALVGQEAVQFLKTKSGKHLERVIRLPNGVWIGKTGKRYTRVSAVLIFCNTTPWNVTKSKVCLYHNPFAAMPYESVLCQLPQFSVQKDLKIVKTEGTALSKILELGSDWPEEERTHPK
ncbi:MAG: hypothetical protein KAX28_06220 [Candidatus Marinimicrobia bacterium]|nr:hypothetical protein [Candidatus Neomarinimicrobiota bacterium]